MGSTMDSKMMNFKVKMYVFIIVFVIAALRLTYVQASWFLHRGLWIYFQVSNGLLQIRWGFGIAYIFSIEVLFFGTVERCVRAGRRIWYGVEQRGSSFRRGGENSERGNEDGNKTGNKNENEITEMRSNPMHEDKV